MSQQRFEIQYIQTVQCISPEHHQNRPHRFSKASSVYKQCSISHNSQMNELVLPENISAYKRQTIYLKLFHVISNKSLMQVKLIAV